MFTEVMKSVQSCTIWLKCYCWWPSKNQEDEHVEGELNRITGWDEQRICRHHSREQRHPIDLEEAASHETS